MGYFSNGTEGMDYQARFCDRCWHDLNRDCPVWLAHLMYNYEQLRDNAELEKVLELLIPRTADRLYNEQCKMFIDREGKPHV